MKIKVQDLQNNMMGIYKITYPNGKIYIGLSNNIKRRIQEHNAPSNTSTVCDLAIKKYGRVKEIEILEFVNNHIELQARETYWIKKLNSRDRNVGYNVAAGGEGSNYGEDNHRSVFSEEDVFNIRRRRFEGERKKDVYKCYPTVPFSTFENVWLGRGYPEVGKEFHILTGSVSRQEYSSRANMGENNNKAKLDEKKVLDIRQRFANGESLAQIHKDYSYVARNTIGRVCNRTTWKHVE